MDKEQFDPVSYGYGIVVGFGAGVGLSLIVGVIVCG